VIFNAYVGAKQTPRILIDVARVFGYSDNKLFTAVVLPAALPYLMAGFRIGVTLGMIMVVVAEFFGASSGLGQKIAMTAQLYQTAEMYAWVLYTSLLALLLVRGMDRVEKWMMRWT
jgi:NitT/TauT family transport system permease protein